MITVREIEINYLKDGDEYNADMWLMEDGLWAWNILDRKNTLVAHGREESESAARRQIDRALENLEE